MFNKTLFFIYEKPCLSCCIVTVIQISCDTSPKQKLFYFATWPGIFSVPNPLFASQTCSKLLLSTVNIPLSYCLCSLHRPIRPERSAGIFNGPSPHRRTQQQGRRAAGRLGRRTAWPPGRPAARPPGRRAARPPGRQAAGPPCRRAAGPPAPECRLSAGRGAPFRRLVRVHVLRPRPCLGPPGPAARGPSPSPPADPESQSGPGPGRAPRRLTRNMPASGTAAARAAQAHHPTAHSG
jgi:hypothetical protein